MLMDPLHPSIYLWVWGHFYMFTSVLHLGVPPLSLTHNSKLHLNLLKCVSFRLDACSSFHLLSPKLDLASLQGYIPLLNNIWLL